MLRLLSVICIWLVTLSAFSQSVSKYQVGTITDVKPHQSVDAGRSDVVSYDVSVKVGDTIYLVVYTPPLGATPVKYAAGRNLLVQVGEKTMRYNNILGQSLEVPIVSRKSTTDAKQSR
jgi:hypothetical protein